MGVRTCVRVFLSACACLLNCAGCIRVYMCVYVCWVCVCADVLAGLGVLKEEAFLEFLQSTGAVVDAHQVLVLLRILAFACNL